MDPVKDTQQHKQKDNKGVLDSAKDTVKATFEHHKANPGPAVPKDFNVAQEGTKEERLAKAKELNK